MEQMSRRAFLGGSLMLALAPSLSALEIKVEEPKLIDTRTLIKKATLEDCLVFVGECKNDVPISDQIKRYGRGEKGRTRVAVHIAEIKSSWIDLAYEHRKDNKVIPAKTYLAIAKANGAKQKKFHKGATKQYAKKVVAVQAKTGEIATAYFRKILKDNPGKVEDKNFTQQYHGMIKESFTEKEYGDGYYNPLIKSMDKYYDALHGSIHWTIGWAAKGKVDKMRKNSLNHYKAIKEKLYPKKLSEKKR